MSENNESEKYEIYIVLSMSGTKFSRFLRIFLKSEFTHVSLSLDSNLKVLYSFGRQKIFMPWIAGYIEESPNEGIFKIYNPMCEVLKLELNYTEYLRLISKIEYVRNHSQEYKYNFLGLVFTYFRIPRRLYKKFTCTQFVASLLNEVGALDINKDVSLVLPMDYYNLEVTSIYKGRLHNYMV